MDSATKKNSHLNKHMVVHLCVIYIRNKWITMNEFVLFVAFTRYKNIDSALKDLTLNVTPKIFAIAYDILISTNDTHSFSYHCCLVVIQFLPNFFLYLYANSPTPLCSPSPTTPQNITNLSTLRIYFCSLPN